MNKQELGQNAIDYDTEYKHLPVLPSNIPPSIQDVSGDSHKFRDWFIPEALSIAATDPGWIADAEWAFADEAKVINMLQFLKDDYQAGEPIALSAYILTEIDKIGGYHVLPAILLRALEKLSPTHPEIQSFWRGGSYGEGQSLHRLSSKEFSLSPDVARGFVRNTFRERPTIFQLPVEDAIKGFRSGNLRMTEESSAEGLFHYSVLVSTLKDHDKSGVKAFRVESSNPSSR